MFHKKTLLTLAVLGLILTAGITSADAFMGKNKAEFKDLTPEERQEKRAEFKAEHEAMRKQMDTIFANNDYDAWVEIMQSKPGYEKFADKITPENFAKFSEMHNLKQAGDHEGAKAIAEELGLPGKIKGGKRFRGMHKGEFKDVNGDGVCNREDLQN